ncbi:MAG TPA: ATP-binding protein [Thermoanaerobaculia bacterium]|nr:ATP-binding protein [Thermoanaerobaculia bacterium]
MSLGHDEEEDLLRSVVFQNAQSILAARQRAEQELLAAKEALETRTAELERANGLIRTIAENAASCLLMVDERGIATYMNPAAVTVTGYSFAEFATAPVHNMLHAPTGSDGHPVESCPIRIARERMSPLKNHRDVFVRKDGSRFPVACSLSPLERDGVQAGAVLEFRDVTDELRAQSSLEEASRRKDEFLATLSHELRTPMTAVLGWTRMLKFGLPEAQVREALDAIEKSAEIQAQLIEDVLDVSRIVAGKMTFNAVPVDVRSVLQAAMTTVHPAAQAKGIEILSSVTPGLPNVLGNDGRLQQVIWNLLSNAVKFTPRGGTITVRAMTVGSLMRLTVQDNGQGIDPAYLPHVFDTFSQQDGSTTRSHEGIGIGLSIARSLIALHGGTIRACSEGIGRGATFIVDLPILESALVMSPDAPRTSVAAKGNEIDELPDLEGLRVIVIDDQLYTRDVLTAIFRRVNAAVRTAESVRQGLELLHADPVDVIVCDLAMPDEDGFAFIRAVRSLRGPVSATPVIALTAFGRPEDRQRTLAAGFDGYLKKPVDPAELATTVLHLAKRR